jgi:3-oxoacyl-[acyl-carrier protein] reductase
MKFKDEVAIITGAASGIGQEVAVQLAKEGAKVVLVDLNTCENTVQKLNEGEYLECLGDIRDPDFVKAVINRTI